MTSELDVRTLRDRIDDLTHRNSQLEEQARQLQYVKTVAELLTGVAHDLNGALAGMLWRVEALAIKSGGQDPELSEGMQDVVGAARYARRVAQQLLSVVRQRAGRFESCRIEREVAEAASLLATLRPRSVRLHVSLNAGETAVWGCAEQLQQLVVNLATNAFDAIGSAGGDAYLEVARRDHEAGEAGEVVLRVRDTGHGMSDETLKRATEPFFTTKGEGEGKGLGLVVVNGIVERHHARLHIESAPGRGTTVEVVFPALSASHP